MIWRIHWRERLKEFKVSFAFWILRHWALLFPLIIRQSTVTVGKGTSRPTGNTQQEYEDPKGTRRTVKVLLQPLALAIAGM